MVNKKTLLAVFVILLFLILYTKWIEGSFNKYLPQFLMPNSNQIIDYNGNSKSEEDSQEFLSCGIANCHGLDIECGKPAEVCTMVYQLGDKCRQFARCAVMNGKCQHIENDEFKTCKACVEKCQIDFAESVEEAFECESRC
ncbi:MAG: hypothetical protein NZM26_05195 [Patescibacteria group bacterium]|nr:hypothetical protein [Patescibacteria group bacterium]